jgi:ABC-type lipoprotein release transport system permease subunit
MRAMWFRARADAHRHLRSWLGLVALIGLTGGAAIAIVAGAERTDTAYQRFLANHVPSDVQVLDSNNFLIKQIDLEAVADLPQVQKAARMSLFFFVGSTATGRPLTTDDFVPVASADGQVGSRIDRWKLLDGSRADPKRVDEAVVDFDAARRLGLEVGDRLTLRFFREDSFLAKVASYRASVEDRLRGAAPGAEGGFSWLPDGPVVVVRIVGIEANPLEFPPLPGQFRSFLHLTPAFYQRHAAILSRTEDLVVRLRPDSDMAAFKAAVEDVSGGATVFYGITQAKHAANVERALHLQALVLWLLAGLIVGASLLVVAQALLREGRVESLDDPTLRAMGMTRRELWAVGLVRTGAVAIAGGMLAVGLAVLVSPAFPLGLARVAEPAPGFDANLAVIGSGLGVIVGLVLLVGAISSWRIVQPRGDGAMWAGRRRGRTGTTVHFLQRSALPVPAVLGVSQVLEPGGRREGRGGAAISVWSTAVAASIAVATLVAAATFAASLGNLLDTPRLYGWSWDTQIGAQGFPSVSEQFAASLSANRSVDAIAVGTVTELEVDGVRVEAFAMAPEKGAVPPALLAGRAPAGPDEIVLGTKTLDQVNADVGDSVDVRVGDRTDSFEVVGRAVFPNIGDTGQLGRGAFLSYSALERSVADAPRNVVLVRFSRSSNPVKLSSQLRRVVAPVPVSSASLPTDLISFGRVDNLPVLVAAVLGVMAAAVLAHTLSTEIIRRRRELAILKTLGFRRRQIAGTIVGQAITLAVIALAVGIPLGVIIGRAAWSWFAAEQGISSAPTVDGVAIALFVPAVILAAVIIAAIPARIAAHVSPAVALRAE